MTTILTILLIIALVIAIFLDFIRIGQYISYRKTLDKVNEELTINRINEAVEEYKEDGEECSFGEYLVDWLKAKRDCRE